MTAAALWAAIHANYAARAPHGLFWRAWFSVCTPSLSGDTLTLTVPHGHALEALERDYKRGLLKAAKLADPTVTKIVIQLEPVSEPVWPPTGWQAPTGRGLRTR